MKPLSNASSARGADMGRADVINDCEYAVEFESERLNWVDGAYDEGGAYWGRSTQGEHIYRFEGTSGDTSETMFVRATSLAVACIAVVERYPRATFAADPALADFISGYTDAALWSTSNPLYDEDETGEEKEMLDDTGYPLSDETTEAFRQRCMDFVQENRALLDEAVGVPGYDMSRAGHDFWLTSSGSGISYSDRDLGDVGDKLDKAASEWSPVNLDVGDDRVIYSSIDGEHKAATAPGM